VAREPDRSGKPETASSAEDATATGVGGAARLDPAPAARQVGRYVLRQHLGAGGMGAVYKAYDPQLDRVLAVKLLHSEPADADQLERQSTRFMREAQAMAKLSHHNVVVVHDVGLADGQVFIAMEYVDGMTLRDWLAHVPRDWRQVVDVFIQAGRGLEAAHHKGLVHRDFKPSNVLVGRDGRVRVADFGLARVMLGKDVWASRSESLVPLSPLALDSPVTAEGAVIGTPAYMAPEQFLGEAVEARTDQYSFCLALHEALFAERPRLINPLSGAVLEARIKGPDFPRLSTPAPPWLRDVIARGLGARPQDRHPSMDGLLAALATPPRNGSVGVIAVVTALLATGAVGMVALFSAAPRSVEPVVAPLIAPVVTPPAPPPVVKEVVEPAVVTPARAPTKAPGRLTLQSKPWAAVTIDGKATGKFTPLADYVLSAGSHTVTLENQQLKRRVTFTVKILSNKTTTESRELE